MAEAVTQSAPAPATRKARSGADLASGLWILVVAAFFLLPLLGTLIFSLWAGGSHYNLSNYTKLVQSPKMWAALWLSVKLAIYTVALTMVLLVPAVLFIRLRAPWLRPVLEVISVMPFVIPPIALVQGLTGLYSVPGAALALPVWFVSRPEFMVLGYVILALPYTYRALDVGMSALDVQTLTQAALSLGANWGQIFARVIVPNLRTAILGATLLTFAIVLGEFVFANILLFNTFAVYINYIGQVNGTGAAALSLFSFFVTWVGMLGLLAGGSRGQVRAGGVG
ncbi:ABC transporter permease [Acidimangrovimonas sediminis]|uniref:ABC transporter permease n=1 Tax=Acidimangrovimonas sediminis TaxID=2056283 RepID=UPI0018EC2438|nr:ABC transporter permease [Acidimangrovimonas sediminis]